MHDTRNNDTNNTGEPLLLSLTETARQLGISHWTLYRALNRRELRSVYIGKRRLVHRSQLEQYIAWLIAQGASDDC